MKYTDQTAVENYRLRSISPSFSTQFNEWNEAVSRDMDNRAGITLVSETETTNKYDGSGATYLVIDPVRSISDVSVDGTTITPLQYPANNDVKHKLEAGIFPIGKQNVTVTGIHARFAEVPSDIKLAATILTSFIVRQTDEHKGGVSSVKLYNYTITYTSEKERADIEWAMNVVDKYKRYAV